MKLKVKVIALSCRGNHVAKHGDEIDHTQLPVPDNWEQLIEDGYLEHTKESKAAVKAKKKALKAAAKAAAQSKAKDDDVETLDDEVDLESMNKAQLVQFAKENNYEINPREKKDKILSDIAKQVESSQEE